jgi:hypothetical protein
VEFFNQIEHVRSNSIYTHDTTLKMAFGANVFADFNAGPPNSTLRKVRLREYEKSFANGTKMDFHETANKLE